MVDMQVVISGPSDDDAADSTVEGPPDERFAVEQQRRRRTVETVEGLEKVWDPVVTKLSELASKAQQTADRSAFQLESIEFQVGIEAGMSIGLVTKADASVSFTFTRRDAAAPSGNAEQA